MADTKDDHALLLQNLTQTKFVRVELELFSQGSNSNSQRLPNHHDTLQVTVSDDTNPYGFIYFANIDIKTFLEMRKT